MSGGQGNRFGKKPNRTIVVPPEFRLDVQFGELEREVRIWAEETGCTVVPGMQSRKLVKFDIFGSGTQLKAAERAVNKWIEGANTKSAASSAWYKARAFDPNKWYYKEISVMETQRKELFKGPIPELDKLDGATLHRINVKWPEEFLKNNTITPRDVFGSKLEQLDSIRTDDEVFINLLPHSSPPWQVEITGYNIQHAELAERHYKNLVEKIRTKQSFSSDTINIILDGNEGTKVLLQEADVWWPNRTHKIAPRLLVSLTLMDQPQGSFRKETLHPDQLHKIQCGIGNALNAVRFDQGSYDFTICFGCLTLSGMKDNEIGNEYSLSTFWNTINTSAVIECHVKKWLINHDLEEQFLARLMSADHLLEPVKASGGYFGFTPETLKEARPTFRGTWVVKDPNSRVMEKKPAVRNPGRPAPREASTSNNPPKPAPVSLMVVQIDWTEDEEGIYEKMPPRFYRLKPGYPAPKENMRINLLELGEAKAWHFGLESMVALPRSAVSPAVVSFANQIKLEPKYAKDPTYSSHEKFARATQSLSVREQFSKLDKIYTFGIKKTGYRVEATKIWYENKKPCWGIVVRHRDWGMHLGELERLAPGHGADWGDTIKTFLPDNGFTSTSPGEDKEDQDDLPDIKNLSVNGQKIQLPRRGIRLLIAKLMQLSQVINSDLAPQMEPSLGDGLAFYDPTLLDI